MSDEDLSKQALEWLKANSKVLIEEFASVHDYVSEVSPTTIFMAGSPGAGKTEVSKSLISRFEQQPVRIDADEIRAICPGYIGVNAHVYQAAATKGVNMLFDHVLRMNFNLILDGTFAYGGFLRNIERSLSRDRKIQIWFVYQHPLQAWDFTKKREVMEQRRVSKETFINAFLKSRINVNEVKARFGDKIELNILIKDFERSLEQLKLNVDSIDPFIPNIYTKDQLENLLI